MSSAKGNNKKKGQKHQNTFAFVPSKHSPVAVKIAQLPIHNVCHRCTDILLWKKQMSLYKPLTQPKTCSQCHLRTIKDAYHVLCSSCALSRNVCAKCMNPHQQQDTSTQSTSAFLDLQKLPERYKRSCQRKLDQGDFQGAKAFYQKVLNSITQNSDPEDEEAF